VVEQIARLAAVDTAGESNPGQGVRVRHFLLLARMGLVAALELEALVASATPLGDCACAKWIGARVVDSPRRRKMETDGTLSDGATGGVDVVTDVSRYLCMRDDGQNQHVEAFEKGVAAGRSGGNPEAVRHGDGVHFDVRRLKSVCDVLPRHRLVRCSRGKGLDRDSPVLRIRMETTRASLLWQAAVVKPEPENGCLV
jgi:hypothetical protein